MRIWLVIAVFGLALLGCGGREARPARRAPTPLERAYPVLSRVPADVSYAVFTMRLADLVTAVREITTGAALIWDPTSSSTVSLDATLAAVLGISPLSLDQLANAGLALDESAAVFSYELWPTAIFPVADRQALARFLEARTPQAGVLVREHDGISWFTWRSAEELAIHWAVLEDALIVRLSLADKPETGWKELGAILNKDKGRALGQAAETEAMTRALRGRLGLDKDPAVMGLVHLERVLRAAVSRIPAVDAVKLGPCWSLVTPLAGPVTLAVDVDWSRIQAAVDIALAPKTVRALADQVSLPPPGFRAYQRGAGLYASAAVNLSWLGDLVRELECPLFQVPDELFLGLPDSAPTAGFMAVEDLQPSNLAGRGALHLVIPGRDFVKSLLDQIPQRSLFERKRTIAGIPVARLAVPVVMKSEAFYRLTDHAFTAALGEDVMKAVLGPGPSTSGSPDPLELAAFRLIPKQVPHLEELLSHLLSSAYAQIVMARLARYDETHLSAELDQRSMVVRAAVHFSR